MQKKKYIVDKTNVAAGFYFNVITRRINNKKSKNYRGESVSWLQIQWMRFLKNEPYKMFYKTSLDVSKFHVLDLSPKKGRPKIYGNIKFLPLYTTIRPVSEEKHKRYYEFTTVHPSSFSGTF